jgi:plastocyanin
MVQGDTATIDIINSSSKEIDFDAGILEVGNSAPIAPGASGTVNINTNKAPHGTYAYSDVNSALLGLFGAIVVDQFGGPIQSFVEANGDIVSVANRNGLDKEFVLFMVGSTFWGTEIEINPAGNNVHTPLWTNPILGSDDGDINRFHVLAVGQGDQHHTFHMHAHRWIENQTSADQGKAPSIIDTKLMNAGSIDTHPFIIKAGAGVGQGTWQYHCHLLSHMESGMNGKFRVGAVASDTPSVAGASPSGAIFGNASADPGLVTFEISAEPGSWFRSARDLSGTTITKSLEVIPPGSSVHFVMSDTNAVHTLTSLLWPADADDSSAGGDHHMIPMDQTKAYKGGGIVRLDVPGLYVFTCKVHPYMFGAVIVDDPATAGLDLGGTMDLVMGGPLTNFPVLSDLGIRLLRTFFVATVQSNWQDYESGSWSPQFPNVPVDIGGVEVADLEAALTVGNVPLPTPSNPGTAGVGEVWIDTQFEQTAGKTKPGTITVLDATNWTIKRKIALPQINMNHPHNIWSSKDQSIIFQTEWFDNKLTFINQSDGSLIDSVEIGNSPSHVVTVPGSDEITVAINGENGIARIPAGSTVPSFMTPTQLPGQPPANPHGHWVTADGTKIMTPNINTSDAGVYNVADGSIIARTDVMPTLPAAPHPIAVGMGKTKFFVANLLDSSLSIFNNADGSHRKTINLLLGAGNYNPVAGPLGPLSTHPFGFLSIQTPVDPTGRVVVTANTGGQITIVDAASETLVAALPCDPGCHGVNFGAKQGGGYYAYVTSKFSNRLLVVDPDPNNDGVFTDAAIVGDISMVDNSAPRDDTVTGLDGMGGQGVYAIPNPYDGWVQQLPDTWKDQLTPAQQDAVPPAI